MNKKMIAILVVVFILGVAYGGFLVSRKISYEIFYENLVQQTVLDMVKAESIREHYKK